MPIRRAREVLSSQVNVAIVIYLLLAKRLRGVAGAGKAESERDQGWEVLERTAGRRLVLVQEQVRAALDRVPPGPVRAISVCAGQGHDLIGVLCRASTVVKGPMLSASQLDASDRQTARGCDR